MCVQDTPSARSSRFAELVGRRALRRAAGGDTIARAGSHKHNDLRRFSDQLRDNFRDAADATTNMRINYRKRTTFFGLAMTMSAMALFMPTLSFGQTCRFNLRAGCLSAGVVCSPVDWGRGPFGKCTTSGERGQLECNCVGSPEPPAAPWDLVPSKFERDRNGFLRMPDWRWASSSQGARLDVCDFCSCREGTWGFDAPDQVHEWLTPSCTLGPIHENSNNFCSGGPAKTFGHDASGVGYHMNWEPVEYVGPLQWEGHSKWLTDNEYQFNILRTDELFLVTKGREGKGVHLEFDSTETVDEWDGTGTWWEHFHHDVVDTLGDDNNAIQRALGTPWAVVIGMLGLDVAHTDHHAELHPVYAMFIRNPPGAPAAPADEVRWSFFVRNWGNEGYCGHDQEQVWIDHIDVQLPDRQLGSVINVRPYRHGQDHGACPQDWFIDPNNVFRFPMASPDMKCGWVGEFTLVRNPFFGLPGDIVHVPPALEEEETGIDPQTIRINKLNSSDREQLNKKISDQLKVARNRPAFGENIPVNRLSSPLRPVVQFKATSTNLKAASDPARLQQEERKHQLIEEFLAAHGIQ